MNELTSRVKAPEEQGPTQFRNFLIAEFEVRKRTNRRYSLRAYARDLQIASSLLSRILNGKVPVTSKMLRRMSSKLGVPPELLADFAREVEELEEKRKESRRQGASLNSMERAPLRAQEENGDRYETTSFVIPCNRKLIPQVTRQIQMFQSSLIEFVKQSGDSQEPVCELRISIRFLVEN